MITGAKKEHLKDKAQDIVTGLVKGSIGAGAALFAPSPEVAAVSLAAPFASELVNLFINPRRLQRVETMLSYVISEQTGLTMDAIREKMADPEFFELMEDAIADAAKAKTDERIRAVSQSVRDGLTDPSSIKTAKRHLFIIGRLSDDDLAVAIAIAKLNLPIDPVTWGAERDLISEVHKYLYGDMPFDSATVGLAAPEFWEEIELSILRLSQEGMLERIPQAIANERSSLSNGYKYPMLGQDFFSYLRNAINV